MRADSLVLAIFCAAGFAMAISFANTAERIQLARCIATRGQELADASDPLEYPADEITRDAREWCLGNNERD